MVEKFLRLILAPLLIHLVNKFFAKAEKDPSFRVKSAEIFSQLKEAESDEDRAKLVKSLQQLIAS